MKILGRPRTWFTIAALWAALVDLLTLIHLDSSNHVATGVLLALPALGALAAFVSLQRWVAFLGGAVYAGIAFLAILSVGLFLGPGLLAMVIGVTLIGVEPPGE